jgi:hypothetical protein
MKKIILFFCFFPGVFVSRAQQNTRGFEIIERKEKKQVDVLWNGKLMTAYCYDDSIRKPFLFPLNTIDGITVTRGYPVDPRPGERTDHPHHTGMWMNYESVNGLDFWNNSTAIPPEKRGSYGTIRHEKILMKQAEGDHAFLTVAANWLHPDGHVVLKEKTSYVFSIRDGEFLIERNCSLTAGGEEVIFRDAKDGFFAIRVARELEMPSQQEDVFVDIHGNRTPVKKMNNEGVTGTYYSSEGLKGDSVWSSKGRWAMLKGQKEGKEITIGIFDHPSNPGYPAYWHARGYGLFAINPLGRKIFSNGKKEFNFSLKPGASVSFRYRVLIASGKKINDSDMNRLADEFAKSDE